MKRFSFVVLLSFMVPLVAAAASTAPQGRAHTLAPRTRGPQPRPYTVVPHHDHA